MLVKEIMTMAPTCCAPETRLDIVAKMMLNHNCGVIPVCDGHRLVGVITDRDIVCRAVAKGMTPLAIAAGEVMSKPVYTVREDENIEAALATMQKRRVRRLPVVEETGDMTGIITQSDIAGHVPDLELANLVRHIETHAVA
jgi:CBS domain-containing protein